MSNEFLKGSGKVNSNRRHDGGGPRPDNNKRKRDEALERDVLWAKLSPQEQLAALDRRLGPNVGAVKQRARIQARIAEAVKAADVGKARDKRGR